MPPVYVADDAEVSESVIGPYVTVESGCRVERAVLTDCILAEDVSVTEPGAGASAARRAGVADGHAALGEPRRRHDAGPAGPEDLPTL